MKNYKTKVQRYNAGASYTRGRRNWRWTYYVLRADGTVAFVGDSYATKREAADAAQQKIR